jgi:starvation-inducible DNA-binding protein
MAKRPSSIVSRTRNDLPLATRESVVQLLHARLADAIDLHARAKHAHWNVSGPTFMQLHELFDRVAASAEEFMDDIAERANALGGASPGLLAHVASTSSLPPYDPRLANARGARHLDAMIDSLAAFARLVRAGIDQSDASGDKNTADLFTGISREADKLLWFVESHRG